MIENLENTTEKPAKVKPPKAKKAKRPAVKAPDQYVIDVADTIGWEDSRYVKTKNGYFLLLRISGIDVHGYLDDEREFCYREFATVLQTCKLPQKFIFVDMPPDMKEQKQHIRHRMNFARNDFQTYLLERQISILTEVETQTSDRTAFLKIFSPDKYALDGAARAIISSMKALSIRICEGAELVAALQCIYRCEWRAAYELE